MQITLPTPGKLSLSEQTALLLSVRAPGQDIIAKTAACLVRLDRFEEALQIYSTINAADLTFGQRLGRARAHIGLGSDRDFECAKTDLEASLALAPDAKRKSIIETELGFIARKTNQPDLARTHFLTALHHNPLNSRAMDKLASLEFKSGRIEALYDVCKALIADDHLTAETLSVMADCLFRLDRRDEARNLRGLDAFLWRSQLTENLLGQPVEQFNQALQAEILGHRALREDNIHTASNHSQRIEEPLIGNAHCITRLLSLIGTLAGQYAERLDTINTTGLDSLFKTARPDRAKIIAWALVAGAEGYESWHLHGSGWLSGVYYVAMPKTSSKDHPDGGAIEFGWSDRCTKTLSEPVNDGCVIRPENGTLLMFPSHLNHRTFPHGVDENKICVAFDIVPL